MQYDFQDTETSLLFVEFTAKIRKVLKNGTMWYSMKRYIQSEKKEEKKVQEGGFGIPVSVSVSPTFGRCQPMGRQPSSQ